MPQTTQYPRDIPNTKATMMVKSNRKESRNGVISLSFYRPTVPFVNVCTPRNEDLGLTSKPGDVV
jgi:hypothetical protein